MSTPSTDLFVTHSVAWASGEMFEASLIGVAGLLTAGLGLVFRTVGSHPHARAMLIPLLVVGTLFVVAGVSGYVGNRALIPQFESAYAADALAFVTAEQARVEGFDALYTFTLILAPVCFTASSLLFWLTEGPHLRATGLALALVGLAGLTIDSFSKVRANQYAARIQAELTALTGAVPR